MKRPADMCFPFDFVVASSSPAFVCSLRLRANIPQPQKLPSRGTIWSGNLAARSQPGRWRGRCIQIQADVELISRSEENATSPNRFFLTSVQTFESAQLPSLCDAWPTQTDKVYILVLFCPGPLHFTVSLTFRACRESISARAIVIVGTEDMVHKHKYSHRGWCLACRISILEFRTCILINKYIYICVYNLKSGKSHWD